MSTHPLFAPAEPLSIASLHAATDPIAIADLDEDWAVPCESKAHYTKGCKGTNPAEWVLWFVGCCPKAPSVFMLCQPCLARLLADPAMWHSTCSTVFRPPATAFRLIEPLNRRTT